MTLPKHRQGPRSETAQAPFWSLELPRWAAVPHAAHPAPETTWTCAMCGALAVDIAAAREHINLHSLQASPACVVTARRRDAGRGRRPLRPVRESSRTVG